MMRVDLILGSNESKKTFQPDDQIVMAIINRTPDSFYDKGSNYGTDAALASVEQAITDGAQIVDIGGVKAGPGDVVDAEEELRRTASFVAAVRSAHPRVLISVDTWRSEVADAVCSEGADLINDAWGGWDPQLAQVAANHGVGIVCTHTGGVTPRTRPHRIDYDDVVSDAIEMTTRLAENALKSGVSKESIIIDPGHDFGKNTYHSLELTRHLDQMVATGWPVLVSLSNKDFVGETLDRAVDDRLIGTLATTSISAWLGARIYRVHNVAQTRQTLDMVSTIKGTRPPAVARRGLA